MSFITVITLSFCNTLGSSNKLENDIERVMMNLNKSFILLDRINSNMNFGINIPYNASVKLK